MSATSEPLRLYLRNLAGWTWNRQADAFRHGNGLCLHEETITEMLLLRMARDAGKHSIKIRMFAKGEEEKNGSDWEWIVKTALCFHRLRVQAKRLYHKSASSLDYGSLDLKKVQHKRLISNAKKKMMTPVYVFYNHDYGKNSTLFKNSSGPEFLGKSHWGCTIAHAKNVTDNRLSTLISVMQPWHELVQPSSCGLSFSQTANAITRKGTRTRDGLSEVDAEDEQSSFDQSLFEQGAERQQSYLGSGLILVS